MVKFCSKIAWVFSAIKEMIKQILKGAANQFGREFGRAGANQILKGSNSYNITNNKGKYEGRIKSSDSSSIKIYKEIEKIDFVSTNKANTTRLILMIDSFSSLLNFKGEETLNELNNIVDVINLFSNKYKLGLSLIDNFFEDKIFDLFKLKRSELILKIKQFNENLKNYVQSNLEEAEKRLKNKKTAIILTIPLLGIQSWYLGAPALTILSILFCWTIIPPLINLFTFFKLLFISKEKFDSEYNTNYIFLKQFEHVEINVVI